MNNATRLLVLIVLVGIAALVGIIALPNDKPDPAVKHTYIEQEQTERIWLEQEFEPSTPIREMLFNPQLLKLHDDNIYIADLGLMKLKRFSLDGALLNTIGMGKGQGPGEFDNITDFYVRAGEVWIASPRSRTISKFSPDGTFLYRFTATPPPIRITGLKENLMLIKLGSPALFHAIDTSGDTLKTFGDLVMDQTRNFMALDGTLVSLDDGGFVYLPMYASFLYHYDASGTIKKVVQTMDRLQFPGVESDETPTGVAFFAPHTEIRVRNGSINNGIFYLHSFFKGKTEEESFSILDRYDWPDGSYVSSTRLPFPAIKAQVYQDKLYCLQDTTFVVYRFK